MSNQSFKTFFLIVLVLSLFASCDSDDVGDNYYTFNKEMMGTYFQNRPEQFSEFARMLDTTKVIGLLNAYGRYTCFAPTNEALFAFYQSKGRQALHEFSLDTITKIVYDHIIKDSEITTIDFTEGRLPQLTMSHRYLSISLKEFPVIKVNITSPIIETDIDVHNGIIHVIDQVLSPTEKTLVEALADEADFQLFTEALLLTRLNEQLQLIDDPTYDKVSLIPLYSHILGPRLGSMIVLPDYKKYGYTALVTSDATYRSHGINNLDDLKAYAKSVYDVVFPDDAGIDDITDPKNSLNRFVAYHLINKQIGYTKFIMDYDNTIHSNKLYDMFEYIEPFCPKSLIEVRTLRTANKTNMFNYNRNTGEYISLVEGNTDNDAINGVYHEIDGILTYNLNVASEISSKRLRLNIASFFPELTNNNMRGRGDGVNDIQRFVLPPGYVERLDIAEGTDIAYYSLDNRLADFQGDELFILAGLYEFTITTPIIPAGTYEVRMGYQPNGNRGAVQMFWDGIPIGIPLDLNKTADDPIIGYQIPGSNPADPFGFENDKMMRNRGYMKGPASYRSDGGFYQNSIVSARLSSNVMRRILGIFTFDDMVEHNFRIIAARAGQFQMDFLEFVPIELLETEGID